MIAEPNKTDLPGWFALVHVDEEVGVEALEVVAC